MEAFVSPEKAPLVRIKGDRDGLVLVLDPKADFEDIVSDLKTRLDESGDFFKNRSMRLDLGDRPFRPDEVRELKRILDENAQIEFKEVNLENNISALLSWASAHLGIPITCKKTPTSKNEPSPLIIRNTCRSGSRIKSVSDCIILGDVNPGAEIIAGGDIVIFGTLRGMAHAGWDGDRSARIWALRIEPNQIRIADLKAIPPRGDKSLSKHFELAYAKDDSLHVKTV